MKKTFKALTLFTLASAILVSCSKQTDTELQPDKTSGIIKMGVKTDSLYFGIQTTTKAEPTLSANDFKIHLENTRAEVLASWASYAEVPEIVKMVYGSYKLVASYGDINKLPMFDAPVYGAQNKFAISTEQPVANVQLDCRPMATKLSVKFDESFGKQYATYKVDVKTVGDSLEHNAADANREAYFKPGVLRFKFTVKDISHPDKESMEYYYNTNVKTKAAEYYTITFKSINNSGQLSVTIATDATTIDKVIEGDVPEFWLPRPAPVVMQHSFGDAKEITTTEAIAINASTIIKTYAGVKSLIIKSTSAELLSMGYPVDGVDIMRAKEAAYSEKIAFLKQLGVTWSKTLDDKDEALNLAANSPVLVDFKDATKNLNTAPGATTTHGFEIILSDKFDQTNEPLQFAIKIEPPVLELDGFSETSIWAKHAFINCKYSSERDGYKPVPEVSIDGGLTWAKPKYDIISDDNVIRAFRVNELTPNTPYQFRVVLGKHIVMHPDVLTTETDSQVENNSFEDWYMDYYDGIWPGYDIPRYYPWKEGSTAYWNTGNDRTTCYRIQAGGANSYTMAPGTMYTYNSKTGVKAAEIRTVSANGGDTPLNSNVYDAESNRVRGRLLIGSYSYSKGSFTDNISYGRPFVSRPTSITFWYQYKPVNATGDTFQAVVEVWHQEGAIKTSLGKATFTKNTKTTIGEYQLAEVPIVYTDMTKKATHFTIEFVSTNDALPRTNKNVEVTYPDCYGTGWYGHIGSILLVDDVTLVY